MHLNLFDTSFTLLPERALYWPEARTLICSDLHWGRESFMQANGIPIPDTSFIQESKIIEKIIGDTKSQEWWILGDWIHHPKGLHPELLAKIRNWLMQLRSNTELKTIRFVPGNHDRQFERWSSTFPVVIEREGIHRKGFSFYHEPSREQKGRYRWFGHLHPKVQLPLLGNVSCPCFWVRANEAYLPAFSRLAGGARLPEIAHTDRIFAVAPDEVIELPRKPVISNLER